MTRTVLAADVGGTNIRIAVVDRAGRILSREKKRTFFSGIRHSSPEEAEAWILDSLLTPLKKMRALFPEAEAAGIGFPGFFEGLSGLLASSPNLPMLENVDLSSVLSNRLDLPVLVQNDALTAAIGEFHFGSNEEHESLIHLTLGTGVGGGLIIGNSPYPGDGGMAMEIGHLQVEKNGRLCGCGGNGCLETYASASAVAARYAEASGKTGEDAQGVYQRALDGNKVARKIIEEAGSYLGMALAETVKILDVRNISISGGLTAAWSMLLPPMQSSLQEKLIPPLRKQVSVSLSSLGDYAGLLGASVLAFDNILERDG
ncbi:MAG: ROK family protein [Mariprofundaceae bacterium]